MPAGPLSRLQKAPSCFAAAAPAQDGRTGLFHLRFPQLLCGHLSIPGFQQRQLSSVITWPPRVLASDPRTMASAVPPNFSWVTPGKLAGLAMPRLPAHYRYMYESGIRHLVSLTERSPPYHDTCPGIQLHRVRIADFCPPSPEQIQRFLQVVEDANAKGEAVAVHCLLGFGRTGTMLACYLVKTQKITGVDAIDKIREIRHGSIETPDQEKAVIQFYQRIK